MTTRALPLALAAALLCATPAPAQTPTPTPSPRFDLPRGYVDYYAADPRGSFAGGGVGRGYGARITLRLTPAAPLDRLAVGAYASHLPASDAHGDMWEYGAAADARVLPAPRRVDPLVTLALGAVHRDDGWQWALSRRPVRLPEVRPRTGFTLSPGVAARLQLAPGVALRGDLRQAFALDRDARGGTEVAGGISLAL